MEQTWMSVGMTTAIPRAYNLSTGLLSSLRCFWQRDEKALMLTLAIHRLLAANVSVQCLVVNTCNISRRVGIMQKVQQTIVPISSSAVMKGYILAEQPA